MMSVFGLLRSGLLAIVMASAMATALVVGVSGASAKDEKLAAMWGALSQNDRTVLEVAAAKSGNAMTTTTGTPNDQFWTALQERGLLERVELSKLYGESAQPVMEKAGFKVFAVTDLGMAEIRGLISGFEKK
ncbi:MAG: hypothetical protein K0U74_08745 [Alphaproteobacteria bacterium]|nr:hypothetical protein [Alphaproteobacteria bacterium]